MRRAVRLAIYIALLVTGPLALFLLPPAWVPYRVTERYAFEGGAAGTPVYLAVILLRTGPYQRIEGLDVRWLRAGGLYVAMVVGFSLLERRWRPGKAGKKAA